MTRQEYSSRVIVMLDLIKFILHRQSDYNCIVGTGFAD